MERKLAAFFSATGRTAKVAMAVADSEQADIYEIKPVIPYTKADLNWMNKKSRSSIEMGDLASRPEIVKGDIDISGYSTIYLGFPIWWYVAPRIINTFLESYDFSGKTIFLFATSGSSDFGNTADELRKSAEGAVFIEGKVLKGLLSGNKIRNVSDWFRK